ncbi:MAG: C40 family peptidase [Clostridia bacterium]|nr:C40 family peptidase [Clostridia bacterium]
MKSKILSIFIISVLILSMSAPLAVSAAGYYGTTTASLLNVRAANSTASGILTQLPFGTNVTVNWTQPGWANITTYEGISGYVSIDYIKIMEGNLPARDASVLTKGQAVLEIAKQYLGLPYRYGGNTPQTGFDCSGFVKYVYAQMGVNLNRVAADQMSNGIWVDPSALQVGDIIGFYNSSGYISHVGIYAGNGMMIHSPQTGDVIKYESVVSGNYGARGKHCRRIFY